MTVYSFSICFPLAVTVIPQQDYIDVDCLRYVRLSGTAGCVVVHPRDVFYKMCDHKWLTRQKNNSSFLCFRCPQLQQFAALDEYVRAKKYEYFLNRWCMCTAKKIRFITPLQTKWMPLSSTIMRNHNPSKRTELILRTGKHFTFIHLLNYFVPNSI